MVSFPPCFLRFGQSYDARPKANNSKVSPKNTLSTSPTLNSFAPRSTRIPLLQASPFPLVHFATGWITSHSPPVPQRPVQAVSRRIISSGGCLARMRSGLKVGKGRVRDYAQSSSWSRGNLGWMWRETNVMWSIRIEWS